MRIRTGIGTALVFTCMAALISAVGGLYVRAAEPGAEPVIKPQATCGLNKGAPGCCKLPASAAPCPKGSCPVSGTNTSTG